MLRKQTLTFKSLDGRHSGNAILQKCLLFLKTPLTIITDCCYLSLRSGTPTHTNFKTILYFTKHNLMGMLEMTLGWRWESCLAKKNSWRVKGIGLGAAPDL